MKVAKFGGSSLASASQINKVCDIILADPDRKIVVVSAPGKSAENPAKVTDLLIKCAEARLQSGDACAAVEQVVDRFDAIIADLDLDRALTDAIRQDLLSRLDHDAASPDRFTDTMKAAGEDNCAKLMAQALCKRGADAHYVSPGEAGLLLSDEPGNAQVLPQSYDNLAHLREHPGIVVFPGFFGATLDGDVATFPRGGSDTTGSILAAAVGADLYENFTDVDSVCAAAPGMVPNAYPINELTYREMRELSYAGFSVFQEEALIPVISAGIPICIKNTDKPEAPGTRIAPTRDSTPGRVMGIACKDGFCTLFVSKYLMNREVGFVRRLMWILEQEGIAFEHMPSGIDDVSVILREDGFDGETRDRVVERITEELKADEVRVEPNLALIMVVGEGMRRTPGIACRIAGALARSNVNIEILNQGASEIGLMIGIDAADLERAVQGLHAEFFEGDD